MSATPNANPTPTPKPTPKPLAAALDAFARRHRLDAFEILP